MQRLIPPYAVLAGIVAIGLLRDVDPSRILPPPWHWAGLLFVILGFALILSAARHFRRAQTQIHAFHTPSRLITEGPFGITRNPIYIGFTLILLGIAFIANVWTGLIVPPAFALLADRWYIPWEERAATEAFPAEYETYRARVRRWL